MDNFLQRLKETYGFNDIIHSVDLKNPRNPVHTYTMVLNDVQRDEVENTIRETSVLQNLVYSADLTAYGNSIIPPHKKEVSKDWYENGILVFQGNKIVLKIFLQKMLMGLE